ncbi:hypothetical protein ACGWY2_000231 [Enterococcus hirae]
MEEYENQVAKYLRKVGNYTRYCVTLDFRGNEINFQKNTNGIKSEIL